MRLGGRFGGIRFAWVRARAASSSVIAVLVVAAVAAALVVGIAVVLRAVEADEVRAALRHADGERGFSIVSAADAVALAEVTGDVLAAHGVRATDVTSDGARVIVAPDVERFAGDDVSALAEALTALPTEAREAIGTRVQVAGGLSATLGTIDDGLQTGRGPAAVAIALVGLVAALVVGAVALEPVRARTAESLLLRARGARRRRLAGAAGIETFVVALGGAAAGAGVVLLGAAVGALPSVGYPFAGIAALVIAVVAAATAAVVTARASDMRPSRARAAAFAGAAVVLAVLTALAAWRFVEAGTPIVTAGNGASIDPLVAIAPALILALAAIVAVLVATPLARLLAASASPGRGVQPVTSLRFAARRPGRHALPIMVVAFAVGIATIAAAYAGSVRALGDAPEALRVGADVRVATIPDTIDAAAVADTAITAGASAAAQARAFSAKGSASRIPVIAIEADGIGDVLSDAGGTIDPAQLGDAVRLPASGVGIPIAGETVDVTVRAPLPSAEDIDGEVFQPPRPLVNVGVTFVSDAGEVWRTAFLNGAVDVATPDGQLWESGDAEAEHREEITLPGGVWSVLAVSTWLAGYSGGADALTVSASSADTVLDLSVMTAKPGTAGTVSGSRGELSLMPTYGDNGAPVTTTAVAPGAPTAAPVVMTAELAASLSLAEGDSIDLEFDGPDVDATVTVAGVVPVLPGTPTGRGLLGDIGTLSFLADVPIAPNQVWIDADDPDVVAAAVAEAYAGPTVLVADPRQGTAAAATAWSFVLAAAGAAVLALVILGLRRTRSPADAREIALLAVLGLGRRGAVRVRVGEDLTALALGLAGGLAAGVLTAWLIVPPLVRAAYGTIPEGYPVPLVWPWPALTVAVTALAGVFALVIGSVRAPRDFAALLREDE